MKNGRHKKNKRSKVKAASKQNNQIPSNGQSRENRFYHPLCHLINAERLYYLFFSLKGSPEHLLEDIHTALGDLRQSACVYPLFGQSDILIRVWCPPDEIDKFQDRIKEFNLAIKAFWLAGCFCSLASLCGAANLPKMPDGRERTATDNRLENCGNRHFARDITRDFCYTGFKVKGGMRRQSKRWQFTVAKPGSSGGIKSGILEAHYKEVSNGCYAALKSAAAHKERLDGNAPPPPPHEGNDKAPPPPGANDDGPPPPPPSNTPPD